MMPKVTTTRTARLLLLALSLWAASSGAPSQSAAVDPSGAPARLRIDRVCGINAAHEGEEPEVRVPVFLSERGDANYLRISLNYDDAYLVYKAVATLSPRWSISRTVGFRETAEGNVAGAFVLKSTPPCEEEPSGEEAVFEVVFTLRNRLRQDPNLLYDSTPISFRPLPSSPPTLGSMDSFAGFLARPEESSEPLRRATILDDGGATIYYQNFVEVGSGEITRRAQSFEIPLYLTVLGDDIDTVSVGVDYDELILREVIPVAPPILPAPVIPNVEAREASFRLNIDRRVTRGRLLRVWVANLIFRFEGTARPDTMALYILPRLLDVQGEGTGGVTSSRSVTGMVEIVEPRFVRGNVDSSVQLRGYPYLPDINDALLILEGLYLSRGEPLLCLEAADCDDNGELDMSDVIVLLNYLFRSADPPRGPFPQPGIDPPGSAANLGCDYPLPYFAPRP
ncbi:MAG: hypothetical protein JXA90_10455 [Planctomycetes bacterium]|nr:hypothetical protein [Planctomycetota bacterium]